jgi:hypothetical protein
MRASRWLMALSVLLLLAATGARAQNEPQPSPAQPSPIQQSPTPASPTPAIPAPSASPAPSPSPAAKEAVPPPSVTIIGPREAHGVMGRDVRSPADEDMGRIVDVIVDRTGTVRAAVIDFGGFLGVGSRKIVVDWNALHFGRVANKGDSITLDLTKAQVAAAPEYKDDAPIVVLGAAGSLQPLEEDH